MAVVDEDQAVTDAAPWGINPKSGKPYKVDPEKMRGLRALRTAKRDRSGGTATSDGPRAPTARQAPPKPPGKPVGTYAGKFSSWLRILTRFFGRRNTVDGLILTAQSKAIADAWGQVCVDYPRFARWIDRAGAVGSLTDAVTVTLMTAGMVAANHGLLDNTLAADIFRGMLEETLAEAGFIEHPNNAPAA